VRRGAARRRRRDRARARARRALRRHGAGVRGARRADRRLPLLRRALPPLGAPAVVRRGPAARAAVAALRGASRRGAHLRRLGRAQLEGQGERRAAAVRARRGPDGSRRPPGVGGRRAVRIACVMSTVGRGGALRVLNALMDAWVRRGDSVSLVAFVPVGGEAFPIPEAVHRVGLGLRKDSHSLGVALLANTERVRAIRAELVREQPDVVVAFESITNVLTLMAAVGLDAPVVVSERIDPRHHKIGRAWNVLRALSYPRASALVVQTESVKRWARSLPRHPRVAATPTPAAPLAPPAGAARIVDAPYLLGMGRLVPQKGFDVLVRAFARVAARFPRHQLVIAGDGAREPLHELARELGVGERLVLSGVLDPAHAMRDADAFVLSSRYEGFPNVLLEAMAMGRA